MTTRRAARKMIFLPLLALSYLPFFSCGAGESRHEDGGVDSGFDASDSSIDTSYSSIDASDAGCDASKPNPDASSGDSGGDDSCVDYRWSDAGGSDTGWYHGAICNDCRKSEPVDIPCTNLSEVCNLEYALFSFMFKHTTLAAIKNQTDEDFYWWEDYFVDYGAGIPEASCETYDAFVSLLAAGKTYHLSSRFPVSFPYTMMSESYMSATINEKGWEYFRNNYGCYYSFTRAGLNKAQDEAVLIRSVKCDSLSGHSEVVVLRKVNGVWEEIKIIPLGSS